MPEPDPSGVEPGENWPRGVLVYHFLCGNKRHRTARALRILKNARWGEWSCRECGDPVPFTRRADAVYCREGCRKKAQRQRRKLGGRIGGDMQMRKTTSASCTTSRRQRGRD